MCIHGRAQAESAVGESFFLLKDLGANSKNILE